MKAMNVDPVAVSKIIMVSNRQVAIQEEQNSIWAAKTAVGVGKFKKDKEEASL